MKFIQTDIPGLVVIEPAVFGDARGYFMETYSKSQFEAAGINVDFVQDNQSTSHKGALRGLHFQAPPFEQGKLVRVIHGAVLDVAVDIRRGSPTYGKYMMVELSGDNKRMFWIPAGFAHGFYTLENDTIFSYKCTGLYSKPSEGGLMWNDPEIGIDWPLDGFPILSEKDQLFQPFNQLISPFGYE